MQRNHKALVLLVAHLANRILIYFSQWRDCVAVATVAQTMMAE
jgi:hypothetical protein